MASFPAITRNVQKTPVGAKRRWGIGRVPYARLRTCLLIVAVFFQLLLLFGTAYSTQLNSDDAAELVQSELIASQGHWMFADGWICTTEVRVLHMQLFMSILFRFFDDWQLIWAMNAVLCGAMVYLSAYMLMKTLGLSLNASMFGALMFLTPETSLYKIACQQPYYSFFVSCSFWLLSLYLAIGSNDAQKRRWGRYAFLLILSAFAGLCGIRYAMILYIPLILSEGYKFWRKNADLRIFDLKPKSVFADHALLFWMVFAHLVGIALFVFWIKPTYDLLGNTQSVVGLVDGWEMVVGSLSYIPERLLRDMLAVNFSGQSIMTKSGLATVFQFFIGLVAIICVYKPTRKGLDETQNSFKQFAYAQLLVTVIILAITKASHEKLLNRYFVIGMTALYPLIALTLFTQRRYSVRRVLAFMAAILFIALLDYGRIKDNGLLPARKPRPGYVDYLTRSGYTFGEATYWNANNTTYMTNGKVEMLGIMDVESMKPYKWGTKVAYFDRTAEFILMTREEEAERASNGLSALDASKIVYVDDAFVIYANQ